MDKLNEVLNQSQRLRCELPSPTWNRSGSALQIAKEELKKAVLSKCPTQMDFVERFNHSLASQRFERYRTPATAYESGMITLRDLSLVYNEQTPRFLLETWIAQLSVFFGQPLIEYQQTELAALIYEEFHYFNLAELALMFRNFKRGKYGVFQNNINPAEILRWCREYRKERGMYLSRKNDTLPLPGQDKQPG